MRLSALAVAAVFLLAACTGAEPPRLAASPSGGSAPPAGATSSATVPVISCLHAIEQMDAPPAGLEVVLDAVALPTGRVLLGSATPDGYFAKFGLVVRADRIVELSVPNGAGIIGWGSPGRAGPRQRFAGCVDLTGWVAFAGGYAVPSPRCLSLTVATGGREAVAHIGVGLSCAAP